MSFMSFLWTLTTNVNIYTYFLFCSQAMAMVDRRDASITDIDLSMQLGAAHPMGPLHLADYIGLDTTYNILVGWKIAHPTEAAFTVPVCLTDMVNKGNFGRKTGKGFYNWEGDQVKGATDL
jgi:3-hydroxyacyl-CoA dehydrogenase